MNITIFYRNNEASNRYISATKHKTDLKIKEFEEGNINIRYINLDKMKFQNFFKRNDEQDAIFVWHDEEILIDYVKENYPNTDIEIMSGKDRIYDESIYYGKNNKFVIYDRILEFIDKYNPEIVVYKIKGFKLYKQKSKIPNFSGEYYNTENEAKLVLKEKLEKIIQYHTKEIDIYKYMLSEL